MKENLSEKVQMLAKARLKELLIPKYSPPFSIEDLTLEHVDKERLLGFQDLLEWESPLTFQAELNRYVETMKRLTTEAQGGNRPERPFDYYDTKETVLIVLPNRAFAARDLKDGKNWPILPGTPLDAGLVQWLDNKDNERFRTLRSSKEQEGQIEVSLLPIDKLREMIGLSKLNT